MSVAAHQSHKHTTLKYPSSPGICSLCITLYPVDSGHIWINSTYNTNAKTHGGTRPGTCPDVSFSLRPTMQKTFHKWKVFYFFAITIDSVLQCDLI